MPAKRSRSKVDDEVVRMIREAMEKKGMMQKDLAAATGMTQPQVSVRLSHSGASIPIHQVIQMCTGVGLDPVAVLGEASERASTPSDSEPATRQHAHDRWAPTASGTVEDPEQVQVNAVARQLATALWHGCNSEDFINIAIEETIRREDTHFWDETRRRWIAEIALAELAYSLGRRYPIRDRFPLKPPALAPDKIIR